MSICNPTTEDQIKHVENMNTIWRQWTKGNVKNRFTTLDGGFMVDTAKDRLVSFVEYKLKRPFNEHFVLDQGEINRISLEIKGYNKGLAGKHSNLLGIVPEGISLQDPTERKFYSELGRIKDSERLHINELESSLAMVSEKFIDAYVEAGQQGKYYKLGIKAVNNLRALRRKAAEATDPGTRQQYEHAIEQFLAADGGKDGDFINQYRELMQLDKKEMKVALSNPDKKYNSHILQAVSHSRKVLNSMGLVHARSLDQLYKLLSIKFTGNPRKLSLLKDRIDDTKDRLLKGLREGGYFPGIPLQNLVDTKVQLDKIMEARGPNSGIKIAEGVDSLVNEVLRSIPETPDQLKAKNPLLVNAWDQDPLFVMGQYGRDAVSFNKLIFAQHALVKAMREYPNNNSTRFIRGSKEFIMEEFAVFTQGLSGRPEWVNNMTRNMNAFQTARTMAYNVTGATKNAASAMHYYSFVGRKANNAARLAYRNNDPIGPDILLGTGKTIKSQGIRDIVDEVEKRQGFLYADVSSEILTEGLVSKDKYNPADIEFNPTTGKILYKGTPMKDFLESSKNWTIGKLLIFHRITENWQRRWIYRTAFVTKLTEQMKHQSYMRDPNLRKEAIRFSENTALNAVNAWAYEYAIHAKAKWVRGDGIVVGEVGDQLVIQKENKALRGAVSEVALHLLHYPMSLLQTHTNQIAGAIKAIRSKQFGNNETADEVAYLMRYGAIYSLITMGAIATNMDLHAIFENETINRVKRVTDDITKYDSPDKATFGLLSEVSGATLGHMKYGAIVTGIIDLNRSDMEKLLFGNVDYASGDKDIERYTAYQYSTEYGRAVNKTWPALRDGRGMDLMRHWLNLYPRDWTKKYHRKVFGHKVKPSTERERILKTLDLFSA